MIKWTVNSATIIGRDHELTKKNRQDFLTTYVSHNTIIGVVCDGCGESQYSEVGASLIGTFVVNYFKLYTRQSLSIDFKQSLESCFSDFLFSLQRCLLLYANQQVLDQISFLKEFMLSTCLFCVILEDKMIVGHCGDGVVINNDEIKNIDQKGKPEYIAYKNIPKEVLETNPSELKFFEIEVLDLNKVNKIVIGTDGIVPIIEKSMVSQLYGTQKRQLQRKFNLWQQEKLFGDDASCIVFEKTT
jgi:serine/threonine protein phosphatase PrpC